MAIFYYQLRKEIPSLFICYSFVYVKVLSSQFGTIFVY